MQRQGGMERIVLISFKVCKLGRCWAQFVTECEANSCKKDLNLVWFIYDWFNHCLHRMSIQFGETISSIMKPVTTHLNWLSGLNYVNEVTGSIAMSFCLNSYNAPRVSFSWMHFLCLMLLLSKVCGILGKFLQSLQCCVFVLPLEHNCQKYLCFLNGYIHAIFSGLSCVILCRNIFLDDCILHWLIFQV